MGDITHFLDDVTCFSHTSKMDWNRYMELDPKRDKRKEKEGRGRVEGALPTKMIVVALLQPYMHLLSSHPLPQWPMHASSTPSVIFLQPIA